jgi:hypothetical protein
LSLANSFALLHPLLGTPAVQCEPTPKQEDTADVDQQLLQA